MKMRLIFLRKFSSKLFRKLREGLAILILPLANLIFYFRHQEIAQKKKIIFALTPPAHLNNIGDHAQVIAIRNWLKKHFPNLPVIELDKEESKYYLAALKKLVSDDDLIIFQSGGNLGERGMWTERFRRLLISSFPNNKIVNLPQSIQFSDTQYGNQEKENTRRIYGEHPDLVMIARDSMSEIIAQELFSKALVFKMPDFVLALPPRNVSKSATAPKILLCLRHDDQSALTDDSRRNIEKLIPYECSSFDTETDFPIAKKLQEKVVTETLDKFCEFDAIVTDRFHGLIFSIVCRKPCIVVPTVDHKLTYGIQWFSELPFIRLAKNHDEIPHLLEECMAIEERNTPDWNSLYFDQIPRMAGIS
ncbi:polysaccharide pyruvyl transferase family protein [Phormidium tenue]|uniref:polysaccharide pyruvyl transferase family protein n=1 Tax=Phormidium tenue TaxID=126344 RepID=UPI0009FD01AC|nr:polysaccharide pyruvyl transferase family protein [Phormidium tenue]MBD2231988.1 polysaccharide pyruvyl transferase family protein [Phormidium tenue FACHB-1052]